MAENPARRWKPATRVVHGGRPPRPSSGPLVPPIVQSATFAFETAADLASETKTLSSDKLYTRWGNPTIRAVEDAIAELEGADRAFLFGSGMAAISTALLSVLRSGDKLVALRDLYGGTSELLTNILPRLGIETRFVEASLGAKGIADAMGKGVKAVYVESPTNPLGWVMDLGAVARAAQKGGAASIVDNTIAGPLGQRPLDHGFDLVCHSATKSLSGHSDVVAGAVACRAERAKAVEETRKLLGGVADPHAAFLLHRGMRTLSLRVERASRNALAVAEALARHPRVRKVFYPGLPSHPGHEIAKRQMAHFGAVVSFEVAGTPFDAESVVNALRLFTVAPSLGGVESLVTLPVAASHVGVSPEDRAKMGIKPETIRLAIGIEDSEDLVADLTQALERVPRPAG